MNLDMSWGDLARACGGSLSRGSPEARVGAIGTDTRTLRPGEAFWALKGPRTDGHDHLAGARRATGWVVERGRSRHEGGPGWLVEVPDALKALHALAAFHRRRFDIPVAAIAGSNGKTSTKEMLRAICSLEGPVCATRGNLNNQFGLPLSVLELDGTHRFAVFELGEGRPGDVDELARVVQPTAGVLTNVAQAHLESFGTLEAVFQCLSELVRASSPSARIAFNLDDPWLAGLEDSLGDRGIPFGRSERAVVRLLDAEAPGPTVSLLVNRRKVSARLPMGGRVHRLNAVAAAAGAVGLGLGTDAVARGLEAYQPAPLRFETRKHPSGAVVVVDAYNANPGSMRAAVETFLESFPTGRRILALGDMKELGPESARLHRELGAWLAERPVEAVFMAGPEMAAAAEALRPALPVAAGAPRAARPMGVFYGESFEAWAGELASRLAAGTAVFIKASRAMSFERLAAALGV